jgi:hypothetical protein
MRPYKSIFSETCPKDSKPRNGRCTKADNSGYLKGVCDKGYAWDSSFDKCVPLSKMDEIQESEYGFNHRRSKKTIRPYSKIRYRYRR